MDIISEWGSYDNLPLSVVKYFANNDVFNCELNSNISLDMSFICALGTHYIFIVNRYM